MKDKRTLVLLGVVLVIVWAGFQLSKWYSSNAGTEQERFRRYGELRDQPLDGVEEKELTGFYSKMQVAYEVVGRDSMGNEFLPPAGLPPAAKGIVAAVTSDYLQFVFEGPANGDCDQAYARRFGSDSPTAKLNQSLGFHSFVSDFACRHHSKALLMEGRSVLAGEVLFVLRERKYTAPRRVGDASFSAGVYEGMLYLVDLGSGSILARKFVSAQNSEGVTHNAYVEGDELGQLMEDFSNQIMAQVNVAVGAISGGRLPDLERRIYGLE